MKSKCLIVAYFIKINEIKNKLNNKHAYFDCFYIGNFKLKINKEKKTKLTSMICDPYHFY